MKVTAKSTIKNVEQLQEHEIMKRQRHHKLLEEYVSLEETTEISSTKKHLVRENCKPNNQLEQFRKLHKLNQIKSNVNRKSKKSSS